MFLFTKWSARCLDPKRIPEMVGTALRQALGGRPGPVYLDLPGDTLYASVDESEVVFHGRPRPRMITLPLSREAS